MIKKTYNGPKYPTKVHGKIPAFNSYDEEANFWDTHDVTDLEGETEEVEIVFDLEKPRDATLIVRLQKELKDKVRNLAKRKGTDSSGLVRRFIIDGLRVDMTR